jgi:hypothetical protein
MAVVVLGPGGVDISGIRAGDVNAVQFTVQNKVDGSPVPLGGYVITSQVRTAVTDTDPAMSADVIVLDGPNGVFMLMWDGETVRTVLGTQARYSGVWDVQLAAGTQVVTIAAGKWAADMDVTR